MAIDFWPLFTVVPPLDFPVLAAVFVGAAFFAGSGAAAFAVVSVVTGARTEEATLLALERALTDDTAPVFVFVFAVADLSSSSSSLSSGSGFTTAAEALLLPLPFEALGAWVSASSSTDSHSM